MGRGKNEVDWSEDVIRLSELDAREYSRLCDRVKKFIEDGKMKNVSSTQIRNIYNKAKRIKDLKGLAGLRPILAYIGKRNRIERFTNLLDNIIRKVIENAKTMEDAEKQRENFVNFLEILLCYRKATEKSS